MVSPKFKWEPGSQPQCFESSPRLICVTLCLIILSGAISNCSPVFSSSILNAFQPRGLIFCCHIFLCFLTVHGVLDARILDSGLPSPPPADHVLSELFTVTRSRSVVPRSRLRALLSYASPYTMTKPWSMRRNTFATDYLHSLFFSSLK